MVTQQLIDYIKSQLNAGKPDAEIKQNLFSGGGWAMADIDEAFKSVKPAVAESPAVPPAPVFSTQPSPIISTPTTSFVPPTRPAFQSASPISSASAKSRGGKHIFLILILILVLLGCLGTAYAYVTKQFFFARVPYQEGELFSGVLMKMSTIQSAKYSLAGSLNTVPRESDATVFNVDAVNSVSLQTSYENDYNRVSDIKKLLTSLAELRVPGNPIPNLPGVANVVSNYPTTLLNLKDVLNKNKSLKYYSTSVVFNDPLDKPYVYKTTNAGKGFTITADFETQEAIDQLKLYLKDDPAISGKTLTLTEKNLYSSFYIKSAIPKPFFTSLGDYMKMAPANMAFTINSTGTFMRKEDNKPSDWQATFSLEGDFDDLTVKADFEARKVDINYYVIVNKFPSMFFLSMLAPIKGQWIKFTSNTTSSGISAFGGLEQQLSDFDAKYDQGKKDFTEKAKLTFRIADETKVLKFTNGPVSEKLETGKSYRYELSLNKSNLIEFFQKLSAELGKQYPEDKLSVSEINKIITTLNGEGATETFDYLAKNLFLTLWTDTLGMPIKFQTRLRIVPPDTAVHLANKQVDYTVSLSIVDVNKLITVKMPDKYITSSEANKLLENSSLSGLGTARAKGSDAAIKSNLANNRAQAELYYDTKLNSYKGVCTSKEVIASKEAMKSAGSVLVTCNDTSMAWAMSAALVTDPKTYWCVDSTGLSKLEKAGIGTNTKCQ